MSWMERLRNELIDIVARLEGHYRDMLDLEFTIQNDKRWMLQVRSGSRTGAAAVRPPEGLHQDILCGVCVADDT